jgi:hypothetical protein
MPQSGWSLVHDAVIPFGNEGECYVLHARAFEAGEKTALASIVLTPCCNAVRVFAKACPYGHSREQPSIAATAHRRAGRRPIEPGSRVQG